MAKALNKFIKYTFNTNELRNTTDSDKYFWYRRKSIDQKRNIVRVKRIVEHLWKCMEDNDFNARGEVVLTVHDIREIQSKLREYVEVQDNMFNYLNDSASDILTLDIIDEDTETFDRLTSILQDLETK